jgi:hypothetical protein
MRSVPRMCMHAAFADDISVTSVHGLANLNRTHSETSTRQLNANVSLNRKASRRAPYGQTRSVTVRKWLALSGRSAPEVS